MVVPFRSHRIKLSNHLLYLKPLNYMQTTNSNTWNHLTVCKQMNLGWFKNVTYKLFAYKCYVEQDLALNNTDGLICHKTQLNQMNEVMYAPWCLQLNQGAFFFFFFFLFFKTVIKQYLFVLGGGFFFFFQSIWYSFYSTCSFYLIPFWSSLFRIIPKAPPPAKKE